MSDSFTVKEALGLSLAMGDSELRWSFDGPVGIDVDRAGGVAEVAIRYRAVSRAGFRLAVERGTARASAGKNDPLPQGTALETQGALGKAIAHYEAEAKVDALSPKGAAAEKRLGRLESEAAALLERARSGLRMAQQFARPALCEPEIETCRAASAKYAGCRFADEFTKLASEIAGVRDALLEAGARAEAERLWNLAQSAAESGQPTLARAYCEAIAGQYPDTDWAGRAKELKTKLDAGGDR